MDAGRADRIGGIEMIDVADAGQRAYVQGGLVCPLQFVGDADAAMAQGEAPGQEYAASRVRKAVGEGYGLMRAEGMIQVFPSLGPEQIGMHAGGQRKGVSVQIYRIFKFGEHHTPPGIGFYGQKPMVAAGVAGGHGARCIVTIVVCKEPFFIHPLLLPEAGGGGVMFHTVPRCRL